MTEQAKGIQAVKERVGLIKKPQTLPEMLQNWKPQIAAALAGSPMSPERVVRVALTQFRKTPKLADCKPESVFAGILVISQMGLEIGYEAHLIPFKDECQVVFDYKGLLSLNYRSSYVRDIDAEVVYSKDHFKFRKGTETIFEWEPAKDDRGVPIKAFAISHLTTGGFVPVVMTKFEIERIRDRSSNVRSAKKYGKTTPWDTDPDEMWKKTVLRRISKVLPKSAQDKHLKAALALENAADTTGQNLNLESALELADGTALPAPEIDAEVIETQEPPETVTDPKVARLNEIMGLLGWGADRQAQWVTANANLTIEQKIAKLEPQVDAE